MTAEAQPEFYSVATVATRLDVCKMTVYRMVESGEIPGVMRLQGRTIRIQRRDVRRVAGRAGRVGGLVITQLIDVLRVLAGRVTLVRPYVCESCPRIRRSLTPAQYQRWAESYVVLCRCGQRMDLAPHPSFGDYLPKVSS